MVEDNIVVAGIDTSKAKLDIAVHHSPLRFSVKNSEEGWQELADKLPKIGVTRVGIEATGGYERGVTQFLTAAGITVVVLQPMQVKALAKLRLKRAKNDKIDAELIASCTYLLKDDNKVPTDLRLAALADQLTFVEQCEEDIARFKTRLEHMPDPRLRDIVNAEIAQKKQLRTSELNRIVRALREHADLSRRFDLVSSIPGIGERTTVTLIVRIPELGQISREKVAALAGLAAFDHDSGAQRGTRHIAGGRSQVRRSLFAAALAAAFHWNPAIIAMYQRLTKAGKCHKVALIACARKLLIFANTVLARGKPWEDRVTAPAKVA